MIPNWIIYLGLALTLIAIALYAPRIPDTPEREAEIRTVEKWGQR